jgi:hypothetical protein
MQSKKENPSINYDFLKKQWIEAWSTRQLQNFDNLLDPSQTTIIQAWKKMKKKT